MQLYLHLSRQGPGLVDRFRCLSAGMPSILGTVCPLLHSMLGAFSIDGQHDDDLTMSALILYFDTDFKSHLPA